MSSSPSLMIQRALTTMVFSGRTLAHLFALMPIEDATTRRDGPTGWTSLEVLGHLLEFDVIFRQRAQRMLAEDHPTLAVYDHEALAREKAYNARDIDHTQEAFADSRTQTLAFFEGLSPQVWARTGLHPEQGVITLSDQLFQVCAHDVNHIEQIARILVEGVTAS